MEGKYALKTDDLLLRLLKDYHQIDVSEVMTFFGERASEMLQCDPNITEKSRAPVTHYVGDVTTNKTVQFTHKYSKSQTTYRTNLPVMNIGDNKVYVLRGFYPDTHIPFKMTLVQFNGMGIARGKVKIGLKEHYTLMKEEDIKVYQEAASEAILLDKAVDNEAKIKYEYRKFKSMRPKGMELYGEKED